MREYAQLALGNQLLRVTILFLYAAVNLKIPAIMEHPATVNDHRQVASSWLLPELLHLQQSNDVTMVHFHQCMLGQISIKPTTLLCVCMPQVQTRIQAITNQCQCNHGYQFHRALTGRNDDGTWRSAKAKTYPSQMCKLLAESTHDALRQRWTQPRSDDQWNLPEEYSDFFIPLDPYLDFHRSTDCMTHRHLRPQA